MSYLFVSYIFTQFKVLEKVFGISILFTGSLQAGNSINRVFSIEKLQNDKHKI